MTDPPEDPLAFFRGLANAVLITAAGAGLVALAWNGRAILGWVMGG